MNSLVFEAPWRVYSSPYDHLRPAQDKGGCSPCRAAGGVAAPARPGRLHGLPEWAGRYLAGG